MLSEGVHGAKTQLTLRLGSSPGFIHPEEAFFLIPSPREGKVFLINTQVPHSFAGSGTLAPVAFPPLGPSPPWFRLSPLP